MPYWKGEKWACYSCTKGHRSSKCTHYDRILYKVRKPGRPLNNCPHVLPDSIPPGTFVNTSAESMANGNPPMEACNCGGDLVQVAIPKVKSCSCLKRETVDTIQPLPPPTPLPTLPETNDAAQNGVKKGRISKRPNPRRKKSIVSEEAVEAFRSEAARVESEKTGAPRLGENSIVTPSRTPCTDPGWHAFDVLTGPVPTQQGISVVKRLVPRDDPPADPNQPFGQTISEVNNDWPQRISGPPPMSSAVSGIDHLSMSQASAPGFPATNPDFNPVFPHLEGNPSFIDQFMKPSTNFFTQAPPNLAPIPQQSVALFAPAESSYDRLPNLNTSLHGDGSSCCEKRTAPAPIPTKPPPGGNLNVGTVTVELTQQEWAVIQQVRAANIDFMELSKVISSGQLPFITLRGQSTAGTEDSNLSSSANSPCANSAYSSSSSPANNGNGGGGGGGGGGGCCSTKPKSPPPPPPFTSHVGCCCGGNQQQQQIQPREEILMTPSSPRCKCGDSCRCVPCADHPHNPAMLAHIRQNMELMDAPQQGMFDPSLGGGGGGNMNSGFSPEGPLAYDGYHDDGDADAPQDSMGDFNDFVICDYKYGTGCAEGMGGCKCGEGCTCIGCLTHGGHDGMLLDMKSADRGGGGAGGAGDNGGDGGGARG
ncbi:hypothetical protein BZA05DRAFT_269166 [Tricharina praecox]|uniref:uncharacterized protein n=1 Tax=Tricharina praecox TaxID=43433 RepID=UPI00221FD108|nr:uncharacterized protein BZA05DRAFT_269166 [Tricharina praecox]KAI5853762.1 hypothetical protein BZA05DRAFT_269166 [Tricharina praecox]